MHYIGVTVYWAAISITFMAAWIVLSALDDFVVDLAFLWNWVCGGIVREPTEAKMQAVPEKRIAIFLPLWQEDAVIGKMLEHNLAAIEYRNYDFFAGAYPNDELTLEAIREWEERRPNVHLAVCPHDGPTSKADCLNWIYEQMLLYEERHGVTFDVVVTHDAEDLIHPTLLRLINYYTEKHDMVQVPVLPLKTPFYKFTHGLYCDEFAEYQAKDVPAREMLGSFIPSNGVGTGYTRKALEKLADSSSNRIFEPACLTEDYENGLRLRKLRCSQIFVPIRFKDGQPVATREYFPQNFRQAVKQRTRWVMGIALQSWERHGWTGGFCQVYWFWRDRKSLIGSPLGLVANALFLCGLAPWLWNGGSGTPWIVQSIASNPVSSFLFAALLVTQSVRIVIRIGCSARIYGWRFAALAPLRAIWGNWINGFAAISALRRYCWARLRGRPLVWLKTDHTYPTRVALRPHKRRVGEMLVSSGYVRPAEVEKALTLKPPKLRLGEFLVQLGLVTEEQLYNVLSLQQNLPLERLDPTSLPRGIARHFPARLVEEWKMIPFRADSGHLFVAGTEAPTERTHRELSDYTRLDIRFHLITPSNFEQVEQALIR